MLELLQRALIPVIIVLHFEMGVTWKVQDLNFYTAQNRRDTKQLDKDSTPLHLANKILASQSHSISFALNVIEWMYLRNVAFSA